VLLEVGHGEALEDELLLEIGEVLEPTLVGEVLYRNAVNFR
jgi:hypothetical protein